MDDPVDVRDLLGQLLGGQGVARAVVPASRNNDCKQGCDAVQHCRAAREGAYPSWMYDKGNQLWYVKSCPIKATTSKPSLYTATLLAA